MGKMRFGVMFPSFVHPDTNDIEPLEQVRESIARCEHYGLDIWVIDHLLIAPGLYGTTWLDPMAILSYAAALTKNVNLGTAILVAPVRQPVLLAKEVGSLQALSRGRFQLGVGPGWHAKEFESVGAHISERGTRTDEMLEALEVLLAGDNASYKGKHYQFSDVTVYPQVGMPPVWVAGGSRIPDAQERDLPEISPSVIRRIAKAGRWLSRASGKQEWVKRDWDQIKNYARANGQDPDSILFGHCNLTYLTNAKTREDALALQRKPLERVMGTRRSFEHIQECYLFGTKTEIIERLQDLINHGCRYLAVGSATADPAQIDIWAKEIIPHLE